MLILKRIALISMAVMVAASPALAGTKFATNIVPSDAFNPATNPTLLPKGQIKLSDKGAISVSLAGVTDAGGTLVTTSTLYNDSVASGPPSLDGTEYTVILKLFLPAIAGAPLFITSVEVPIPVDLKAGKGKTKLSVASLLSLLGPSSGRAVEIRGAEVWGPIGAGPPAVACTGVVSNPLPVGLPLAPGLCRGGTQIGLSGLSVPLPAP